MPIGTVIIFKIKNIEKQVNIQSCIGRKMSLLYPAYEYSKKNYTYTITQNHMHNKT